MSAEVASVAGIQDGRTRILSAALEAFSTLGFGGASLRQIAETAGVQHQLVVYHFKTKLNLWKTVIEGLVPLTDGTFSEELHNKQAASPAKAVAEHIRLFVRFTARHPELHRILTIESQAKTDRLDWLLENFVQPYFNLSTNIIRTAQKAGIMRKGDPAMLHYALIGMTATYFVGAIEYEAMTGTDPFAPSVEDRVTQLAYDFFELDTQHLV